MLPSHSGFNRSVRSRSVLPIVEELMQQPPQTSRPGILLYAGKCASRRVLGTTSAATVLLFVTISTALAHSGPKSPVQLRSAWSFELGV
jgi:hypothetical protein